MLITNIMKNHKQIFTQKIYYLKLGKNAKEYVTPLSVTSLSQGKVYRD